jgi:hypothetical protein
MSVKDKDDNDPFEDAWEDDKEPSEEADELIAADIIPPAADGAEDVEESRRN